MNAGKIFSEQGCSTIVIIVMVVVFIYAVFGKLIVSCYNSITDNDVKTDTIVKTEEEKAEEREQAYADAEDYEKPKKISDVEKYVILDAKNVLHVKDIEYSHGRKKIDYPIIAYIDTAELVGNHLYCGFCVKSKEYFHLKSIIERNESKNK